VGSTGGLDTVADTHYPLLRHLTLPVVAVTSSADGRTNGMISNSAQRASLVPELPRISLYISKTNFTHDIVMKSGVAGIHLLRRDQWNIIWHLGFQSGRDVDKLATVATHTRTTGAPLIDDVLVAFDCRVLNIMDAGAATFFLLDVVDAHHGESGEVMTSSYFRDNMPAERKIQYEQNLVEAMKYLAPMSVEIDTQRKWNGAITAP
jgi:flavin reductase (DIM6/NTAB) family NADH-FMN oxidoreductase RutF